MVRSVMKEMTEEANRKQYALHHRPDVPSHIVDQINSIWDKANTLAEERFEKDRKVFQTKLAEAAAAQHTAEQEAAGLRAQSEALQTEVSVKAGEITALRSTLHVTEDKIRALNNTVHDVNTEMARIRKEADERVTKADARIQDITTQANTRIELAEERYQALEAQLHNAFDRQKTTLLQTISELKALLDQAEQNKRLDREKTNALDEQLHQTNALLAEVRGRLVAVEEERDGLRRQIASRGRKVRTWGKRSSSTGGR